MTEVVYTVVMKSYSNIWSIALKHVTFTIMDKLRLLLNFLKYKTIAVRVQKYYSIYCVVVHNVNNGRYL